MSRMSMGNVRRSPDCRGGSICSHNPGGTVATFAKARGFAGYGIASTKCEGDLPTLPEVRFEMEGVVTW
jgi:hypothetical protein